MIPGLRLLRRNVNALLSSGGMHSYLAARSHPRIEDQARPQRTLVLEQWPKPEVGAT
jgi:hypothetical protein